MVQSITLDEIQFNATNEYQLKKAIEQSIPCQLPKTDMICVRENGQYVSTDSFKYPSRVIHTELKIAFTFHSLRHTFATYFTFSVANGWQITIFIYTFI